MKSTITSLVFVTFLGLCASVVNAAGKGPRGLHALSERYVLVCEVNLDVLLVVDVQMGGVAGIVRLHDKQYDPQSVDEGRVSSFKENQDLLPKVDTSSWLVPTDVATCLDCNHMYLVGTRRESHIHRVNLPVSVTWKKMIDAEDFSPLSQINPLTDITSITGLEHAFEAEGVVGSRLDPSQEGSVFGKTWKITMSKDGKTTYFTNMHTGVWQMDHKEEFALVARGNDVGIDGPIGIALSSDEHHLFVTNHKRIARIHIYPTVATDHTYDLDDCEHGGNSFLVLPVDHKHAYGFSHNGKNVVGNNTGFALYRFYLQDSHELSTPSICRRTAGDENDAPGWIDGMGLEARFTQPHSITMLPSSDANSVVRLVAADIDNRALRLIEISNHGLDTVVFSIDYDDDLWMKLYFGKEDQGETELLAPHSSTKQWHRVDSSWDSAEVMCKTTDSRGRLCHASEIRDGLDQFPVLFGNDPFKKLKGEGITVWTGESCSSCLVHNNGYCPDLETLKNERGDDFGVDNTEDPDLSFWGHQYFQTALILKDEETGEFTVRNQCRHRASIVEDATRLCCVDGQLFETKESEGELGDDANLRQMEIAIIILAVVFTVACLATCFAKREALVGYCLVCCLSFCNNTNMRKKTRLERDQERARRKAYLQSLANRGPRISQPRYMDEEDSFGSSGSSGEHKPMRDTEVVLSPERKAELSIV